MADTPPSDSQPSPQPNRLYIGPITRAALGTEIESVRIGEMEIRGRSASIHVYQVLPKVEG